MAFARDRANATLGVTMTATGWLPVAVFVAGGSVFVAHRFHRFPR
jgi:hypothetical protein